VFTKPCDYWRWNDEFVQNLNKERNYKIVAVLSHINFDDFNRSNIISPVAKIGPTYFKGRCINTKYLSPKVVVSGHEVRFEKALLTHFRVRLENNRFHVMLSM
jgi:hypothetical protein